MFVNDPYSGKTVTGGIITITDSNWLMSFTCNRQPHFPGQPMMFLSYGYMLYLWIKKEITSKSQCHNVREMKF
nr:oleate hydratase [Sphingobacterium multivorum]